MCKCLTIYHTTWQMYKMSEKWRVNLIFFHTIYVFSPRCDTQTAAHLGRAMPLCNRQTDGVRPINWLPFVYGWGQSILKREGTWRNERSTVQRWSQSCDFLISMQCRVHPTQRTEIVLHFFYFVLFLFWFHTIFSWVMLPQQKIHFDRQNHLMRFEL